MKCFLATVFALLLMPLMTAPAWAARNLDLNTTVGLGSSYMHVRSDDPGVSTVSDVQARLRLANDLSYDNAYIHMGVFYEISGVHLIKNSSLDHIAHDLRLEVDVNRWVQTMTEDGRLEVILEVAISPSLPPIDPGLSDFGAGDEEAALLDDAKLVDRSVSGNNALNINEDVTGYQFAYGLRWEDQAGPNGRYNLGAVVNDQRYDGGTLDEATALKLSGGYAETLLVGRTGFDLSHSRFIRGGRKEEKVYGVSGFFERGGFGAGWGMSAGLSMQTNPQRLSGAFGLNGNRRGRTLVVGARYSTDIALSTVGHQGGVRVHNLAVTVGPAQEMLRPVWLAMKATLAEEVKRAEATLQKTVFSSPLVFGTVSYTHAGMWWFDETAGRDRQRQSDVVGFEINWRFT